MRNLFTSLPDDHSKESFEALLETEAMRVERIVSFGQASPPGFWYDQEQAEWVVVVQGSAQLRFADPERTVELHAGDWINIAAGEKHRVEWTAPARPTIWLAIHYRENAEDQA